MRSLCLLFLVLLGPFASAQRVLIPQDDYSVRQNGLDQFEREVRVQSGVAITHTPLFANAPFLRLRPGDQLMHGKYWMEGKGAGASFEDYPAIYLKSGLRFAMIQAWDFDKSHELSSPAYCLLFDWEAVTIANAEILRKMARPDGELTIAQYQALLEKLKREMPEIVLPKPYANGFEFKGDFPSKLVDFPPHSHVVLEGIAYDDLLVAVYKYKLSVGPSIYLDLRQTLLQGECADTWGLDAGALQAALPSPALRSALKASAPLTLEVQADSAPRGVIANFAPPPQLSPEEAAVKLKQYQRMLKFKELVRIAMEKK